MIPLVACNRGLKLIDLENVRVGDPFLQAVSKSLHSLAVLRITGASKSGITTSGLLILLTGYCRRSLRELSVVASDSLDAGLVQQQLDSLATEAGEERRIRVRIRTPATEGTLCTRLQGLPVRVRL